MEMQLRSPVKWAGCVGALVELGCDMFVEVGPKKALTGMMRELAPGAAAVAIGTPSACAELVIPS
jgi:[acyl-carrier-protein] S-malonyltransferase